MMSRSFHLVTRGCLIICRTSNSSQNYLKVYYSSKLLDKLEQQNKHFIDDIMKLKTYRQSSFLIQDEVKKFTHYYNNLLSAAKLQLLLTLGKEYAIDLKSAKENAKRLASVPLDDFKKTTKVASSLKQDLTPDYVWLLGKIALLPDGVKFLVSMRADLLTLLGSTNLTSEQYVILKTLSNSLKDLLSMWFSLGLFHMERVTWNSPCHILEKISNYEAVHPVRNWLDMKKRVGPYRRCFILTHNSMPDEPIVVLHVALTDVITSSIQSIVFFPKFAAAFHDVPDDVVEDKSFVLTAIFYSIYTTQKGLQGIELGTHMIKRVTKEIQNEFPDVQKFSTLSPIPGYRVWFLGKLNKALQDALPDTDTYNLTLLSNNTFMTIDELKNLKEVFRCGEKEAITKLRKVIHDNSWVRNIQLTEILEPILMRACAYYLYFEKHRTFALNSVANFHLKNGATMWQINWNGDQSTRGLTNSCGIMANYRYFLEQTSANSQNYYAEKNIAASEEMVKLAEDAQEIYLGSINK